LLVDVRRSGTGGSDGRRTSSLLNRSVDEISDGFRQAHSPIVEV